MKKFIIIFTVLLLLLLAFLAVEKRDTGNVALDTSSSDGTYCFYRLQEATDDAPYRVEEHISLTLAGNMVSGTKEGTQAGPDMTNGYFGTLEGTRENDKLELIYFYTVEGSENKELELYSLNDDTLVKMRYPLKEENNMLVPDETGTLTQIEYTGISCQ